ncbi:MAG: hypothetical protein RIB80_06370 [Rhodospirillales bacterium]
MPALKLRCRIEVSSGMGRVPGRAIVTECVEMTSSLFSKVSRTALAVVGIFAVTGCVGNGPSNIHPAVSSVPAGLELLSFNAPGLAPQSALRAEYKDNYQEEEYALFKGEGGAQAEVISVEASFYSGGAQGGDRHVLDFAKLTRETLEMWNMSKAANLKYADQSFSHRGKVPYYLLAFERGQAGQSCVGFHAEFNMDPVDPRARYDNHLFGYYCAPAGTKMSRDDMIAAVDGLDIAGVTAKAPSAVLSRPFQQLKNDPQLAEMIQRGGPDGSFGMAAFPLDIAQIYQQEFGGSDVQ